MGRLKVILRFKIPDDVNVKDVIEFLKTKVTDMDPIGETDFTYTEASGGV